MYYGLTSFYQNHRHYVRSRNEEQLLGDLNAQSWECDPYQSDNGQPYAPCGLIANSKFNGDAINVIFLTDCLSIS